MMAGGVKMEQRADVEPTDWELVRKCQAGDLDSFQQLAERYYQKVFLLVLGILRDREDALEVSQDVFCKAFKNIRGFRGGSAFYTWLYRIAVNRAIDFRRRSQREARQPRKSSTEMLDGYFEQGNDPHRTLEKKELRGQLLTAMAELTPEHRAVIILRAVEGLSYKEISLIAGCSEGTVMSRLHYARKKLQEKLAPFL